MLQGIRRHAYGPSLNFTLTLGERFRLTKRRNPTISVEVIQKAKFKCLLEKKDSSFKGGMKHGCSSKSRSLLSLY